MKLVALIMIYFKFFIAIFIYGKCCYKLQIACICEALQQSGDTEKLTSFLWTLPPTELVRGHEAVLRARASVAFHRESFQELYAVLESYAFSSRFHPELSQLWYRAHYREAEKVSHNFTLSFAIFLLEIN